MEEKITTGTMNPQGKATFRSFEVEGASILARISFGDDGPALYIEGYDAGGRYRRATPTYLDGESSEVGFSYLAGLLDGLTAEEAYKSFTHGEPIEVV